MTSLLSRFRAKFPTLDARPSEIIEEQTGEVISELTPEGYEKLDATPLAPPVGFSQTASMHDLIRAAIQSDRLRQEAEAAGFESFEDADDFDVDDDYDPTTPWEKEFDPHMVDLRMRQVDLDRLARGQRPRYYDDYVSDGGNFLYPLDDEGTGVKPLSVEPKAPTPEPKAPSKAKKADTTSDDED